MSTFLDDLRLTGPTLLTLVPRLSSLIYETYLMKLAGIPKVVIGSAMFGIEMNILTVFIMGSFLFLCRIWKGRLARQQKRR